MSSIDSLPGTVLVKMGGQVSKIMGKIFGSKEMRLLMLGLDAAGKTSSSHPLAASGYSENGVADRVFQLFFIN